jgi:glutamyl-tRNA reductase
MSIVVIGTNHKFSPIEIREKLSFYKKSLAQALSLLKERPLLKGAVILSTCNRVELYASAEDSVSGIKELQDFLCQFHEIRKGSALPYLYIYEDKEAVRHLFSVACGLDSIIVGEAQISGQIKSAFLASRNADFTDKYLDIAFSAAITFAKRIHRETSISEGRVSIGSVAIDFIKERLGSLSGKNILIIGAGKVTELVLKYLKEENPNVIFISNRTFDKAKELAFKIGQTAVRLERLPQFLDQADVIISATKSPHFIIKKETLEGAVSRKLVIVDLAVPRDIDPEAGQLKNIELFNLEDLAAVLKKNLDKKRLEAEKITALIDKEAHSLWQRLTALEPEPALLP